MVRYSSAGYSMSFLGWDGTVSTKQASNAAGCDDSGKDDHKGRARPSPDDGREIRPSIHIVWGEQEAVDLAEGQGREDISIQ